ncbi:mechanosensitive ion channel family protein [Neptunomonas phycophila]|uniref:Mechanosensitive ion channel family protein n=1 Tax=Neptunomonas phycophila TaxID=1572645 RepID=A0AAW7XGV0_9GAMM|nr:mechanosensitive ion channel family protein [Neptunomonas phycophila]MDO6452100.1 mechanosensitive ion channel family protein [Neptunomonas phycophila]
MEFDGKEIAQPIQQWITESFSLNQENAWIVVVFAIVLVTLIVAFVLGRFFNRLHKSLARTRTIWDDLLIEAMRKPVIILVWVIGGGFAFDVIDASTGTVLLDVVTPIRKVSVIILIGWFLVRFVGLTEKALIDPVGINTSMDETTVSALGKLVRLALIITIGLVVLQTFGYSISGVLAFGGIGGIAVGFAAKDLLANFFGGLMIYLDRPFKVGDWVRSPDKNIEGTVEDIGWRLTRIRTFDKRPLYVPNATFTSISVENPSRMTNRRIYETVGVRYCDVATVRQIVTDVKNMLRGHEAIDQNQTMIVNLNTFAPSSLDFFIYTFTKTTDWIEYHEIKEDVLLKVMEIIESNNAEVAFPTSTVHLVPEGEFQMSSVGVQSAPQS